MKRNLQRGGRAFDASGASGLTFLQSQLEYVDTDVTKPLQDTTHARDITVEFGGGLGTEFISATATNYGTTGGNQYGLQGTSNTDIAEIEVDIQKGVWKTFVWGAKMFISYVDLQRMAFAKSNGLAAPFSLQELMEDGIQSVWAKALDKVAYQGFLGQPGLINSTVVPETTALTNGSNHVTWSAKLGDSTGASDILSDVNNAINQTVYNSGFNVQEGMADTMLLPYAQFALLTRPMTIGGVGFNSILEYIKKNCVAAQNGIDFKIFPLPNPWISGQGSGSTDRAVIYKNNKKSLYLRVPQIMQQSMTVPTSAKGGGYDTIYNGCISQVIWKRPTTALYMDGI